MTGIPLCIAEPTGRYRRSLRRYKSAGAAGECPVSGYHNASAEIGDVAQDEREEAHGDNWPHADPRWPAACPCGGYEFTADDAWQRNDDPVFRLPDGAEFPYRASFGKIAPAGTMVRAAWYDDFADQPGESWIIALPDGGEWITTQQATGGGGWTVTGTPPAITVSPSIFHNAPHGWHGWIRDGLLEPA